jgi:hypothetical protein
LYGFGVKPTIQLTHLLTYLYYRTAAAIAYGLNKKGKRNVLVFDLGGGAFPEKSNPCQWHATGRWFSPGSPVSSTNKTDRHDITEILLKVAFNAVKMFARWFEKGRTPVAFDEMTTSLT